MASQSWFDLDNIIVTDSIEEAETFMEQTFGKNRAAEKKMFDETEQVEKDRMEADRKQRDEEEKKRKAKDEEEEDDDDDEEDEDDKKRKDKDEL